MLPVAFASSEEEKVASYLQGIYRKLPQSNKVKLVIDYFNPSDKRDAEASYYISANTIVLSSQWLLHFDYEDEIAYILAHELSHGLLNHRSASDFELSKQNELAADNLALELISSAGLNPCGSLTAFKKTRWVAFGFGSFLEFSYPEYGHPRFGRRIKEIKEFMSETNLKCTKSTKISKEIRNSVKKLNLEYY
jgi:predicted Zn-dependent protease